MTLGCIARCLKIIEKGLIQHYETCGQAVLLDRSLLKDTKKPVDNPKMKKKINETFLVIFNQCAIALLLVPVLVSMSTLVVKERKE